MRPRSAGGSKNYTCRRRSPLGARCRAVSPTLRMGMLGEYGLTWPWESLNIEALAWYDHWLKGADTCILDGPAIRYIVPGADEWDTAESWRPASGHRELVLRADGGLDSEEGDSGSREFMVLGAGLGRAKASTIDPPSSLTWTSGPLDGPLEVVGGIELQLVAAATAADTAWIVTLQDVAPDGSAEDVTAGWVRASLCEVDEVDEVGRRGRESPGCTCSAVSQPGRGTHRPGRNLSNPIGAQRPPVQHGTPHPAGADQRRPRSVDAGHHELPSRQRRHQASTPCARRRGCCCQCSREHRRQVPCRTEPVR